MRTPNLRNACEPYPKRRLQANDVARSASWGCWCRHLCPHLLVTSFHFNLKAKPLPNDCRDRVIASNKKVQVATRIPTFDGWIHLLKLHVSHANLNHSVFHQWFNATSSSPLLQGGIHSLWQSANTRYYWERDTANGTALNFGYETFVESNVKFVSVKRIHSAVYYWLRALIRDT